MTTQNICKTILPKNEGQFSASNFIYETIVPHSGITRSQSTHILHLVAGGEGFFHCAGKSYPLSTGILFFSFREIPYMIENRNRLKYYYISFSGDRAEALFRRYGITLNNCVFPGYEGLLPLWQDSITRAEDENIDLLSESLVLYTFSRLKQAVNPETKLVHSVLLYLEKNFTDEKCSLADAATVTGYNQKYLSHAFKKEFGMNFTEYLRVIRIKHAVLLIENGVTSVKDVAYLCGFSDPLYFSKVFTGMVGVSPRNYRKTE